MTAGPAAPKDPRKHRPFFYIMRDKEIFGADSPGGKGVQFIYENDGRLINSAQIVGSIDDRQMLDLLKDTKGFRKLVHSIGVSVEAEDCDESLEFIFQMYGKNDMYGGGTLLRANMQADGMETQIVLDDAQWSDDDSEPGQIRFEFDTPLILAKASVRLYLNDGYTAPPVEEENCVDLDSGEYRAMIRQSLMQLGDTSRICRAIARAKRGEDVTVAYIGGSITQGAGATPVNTECYAYKSWQALCRMYGADHIHFVKAGVGGTPSELGMLRFDRDILRDGKKQPDIVAIEFAVNDEGDETKGCCYESLVRKVLDLDNHPAVILLFSVFANDWNLQERLRLVGERYHLPMVSVMDAVTGQFARRPGEGRIISKNQFFYDIFHPSNIGHTIMADCLTNLFVQAGVADGNGVTPDKCTDVIPVYGADFVHVRLLDRKDTYADAVIDCGGFTEQDENLQAVEMDDTLALTPEFPYNWMYDGSNANQPYFRMTIKATAILLIFKDSGEVDAAKAEVFVDGKKVFLADPHVNGWIHCNPKIIWNGTACETHTVEIRIVPGDEDKKFTILGFGYVI